MARISITKCQGTGNDFVLLDRRAGSELAYSDLAQTLCDRHLGVGADGLLVVERASNMGADVALRIFNALYFDPPEDAAVVRRRRCADNPNCFYYSVSARLGGCRMRFRFTVSDTGWPASRSRVCARRGHLPAFRCRSSPGPVSASITLRTLSGSSGSK